MGISDCVDGDVGVDCSVGTIVWVRRRNGSWWPGRILGPDELSASHLMSPRSGTPVKLLGRDDASVDWYNLEKSKRVKAFRCGEFDACIERAEASHGIPIKKREKYARREDAILHALELEEKQKLVNLSIGISSKTSGAPKRELDNFFSEVYLRNDEPGVHSKFACHKSQAVSRKATVSHDEDNVSDSLYARKGRSGKQFVWEEDIPEAIPRMRGLQDFGLRIAPSKKKLSPSVTWETSRRPVDYDVDTLSNAMMGGAAHSGSSRNSLSIKRKRRQGGTVEESLVKKRDKRRPLVQVLQSSVKLPVSHSFPIQGEKDHIGAVCRAKRSRCIYLPADLNDSLDHSGYSSEEITITATQFEMDNRLQRPAYLEEECTSSGLIEATESDSSGRDFWEAGMEDEANLLTDTTEALLPGSKDCDPSGVQISDKFGNIIKDMALSRYIPELHPDEQAEDASAEGAVSKWHMKGKRNARNLPKRTLDAMDEKVSISSADNCNGFSKGKPYESKGSSFRMGLMEPSIKGTLGRGLYHEKGLNHACERGDSDSKDWGPTQLTGYGNRRHPFPVQAVKDRGRSHIAVNDSGTDSQLISQLGWEADVPSHVVRRAHWVGSDECFEPVFDGHISDEMEPMLVDVTLKVQASYQGEHVPLVSLMSRLNGKAIIGHPVQIEIIEGGPAGQLVSGNDAGLDESTATQPVWRTARRTAMQRLPRSNPAASSLEGEDAEPLQYSDHENKPPLNRSYSGLSNHHAKLVKKSFPHDRRPVWGKPQKNLLKRVCLSNQKTRTLSSIATEQKPRGDNSGAKLSRVGGILGGLIKPDGAVPLVTCVPVKVVFSRILEAVGRPSAAAAHRVRMTSPAVRYPSCKLSPVRGPS